MNKNADELNDLKEVKDVYRMVIKSLDELKMELKECKEKDCTKERCCFIKKRIKQLSKDEVFIRNYLIEYFNIDPRKIN